MAKKPLVLPTFSYVEIPKTDPFAITGDNHLTNSLRTREYSETALRLFIYWMKRNRIVWVSNGDWVDYLPCFFEQVHAWLPDIYKLLLIPGNHDEQVGLLSPIFSPNFCVCDKDGFHFRWGERDIFITHGARPWDIFWSESIVRKCLGKALLSASTHAQKLIHPAIDDILMLPVSFLEHHIVPKGMRLGYKRFSGAAIDVVIDNIKSIIDKNPVVVFSHTHIPVIEMLQMPQNVNNSHINGMVINHLNPASWQRGYEDMNGKKHREAYQGIIYLDPAYYPKIRVGQFDEGFNFKEVAQV